MKSPARYSYYNRGVGAAIDTSCFSQYVSRKAGEIILDGANPSAEEADEGAEDAVESGCDIVLAHRLAECFAFGDKKSYTQYLKDYMKR